MNALTIQGGVPTVPWYEIDLQAEISLIVSPCLDAAGIALLPIPKTRTKSLDRAMSSMLRISFAALLFATTSAGSEYACPTIAPAGVSKDECKTVGGGCPHVDGGAFKFIGGKQVPYEGKTLTVTSPIYDLETQERMAIGTLPDMVAENAVDAVNAAAEAWDRGQGQWPQMSLAARIDAIEKVVAALRERRSELINVLMWEICKSSGDAAKEVDRTLEFVAAAIAELKKDPTVGQGFSEWGETSGVGVRVRRGPIGVMLALAPFVSH